MTAIWIDTFSEGSWWQLATPKSMSVRIVKGTLNELEFLTIFFTLVVDLHVLHFSNLSEDHQAQVQVQNFWNLNSAATQIGGPVGPNFSWYSDLNFI